MKKLLITFTIISCVCLVFSYTQKAKAACTGPLDSNTDCYQPLSPITDPAGGTLSTTDFPTYMQAVYRIGIGICFVLGVIMFTWAGIEYILSESMNTKSDAKKRIAAALTGLAIALVSYILLNTINPDILKLQPLGITAPNTPAPATPAL